MIGEFTKEQEQIQQDVATANASGKLFRVEHSIQSGSRVVFLEEAELADLEAPAGERQAFIRASHNTSILAALAKSDAAMLRAIEEGDAAKIAERRAERQALRGQLVK